MLDFQAVGEQIHNLRVSNGYSQDSLAEELFVSRQAVSRWELGLTLPSVDNLVELCRLFNVSFEEILCFGKPKHFDKDDIFKGHSREYVVKSVLSGDLKIDVAEKLYLFSPTERAVILKAVRDKKLPADLKELELKITDEEKAVLYKNKNMED